MSDKLATRGVGGSIELSGLQDVWGLADRLAKAHGFVPAAYRDKPEALAACVLTGIELGMGPMEAMRSLHIIEGKPTLSADAMLGRAIAAGVKPQWLETSDDTARIRLTRAGFEPFELTFSKRDAQRAGLWDRGTWKKYPAAMLRARAVSAALRAYCPDVLGSGVYTADEVEDAPAGPPVEVVATVGPVADVDVEPLPVLPPPDLLEDGLDFSGLDDAATPAQLLGWVQSEHAAIAALRRSDAPAAAHVFTMVGEAAKRIGDVDSADIRAAVKGEWSPGPLAEGFCPHCSASVAHGCECPPTHAPPPDDAPPAEDDLRDVF